MRWRGEKRIHTFYPPSSSPTLSPTRPLLSLQPPLPHYLHSGKSADKRDNPPPSGRTSPSQLRLTKSDGCLIVRDTDRALSLSNLKQIASPWGGDYWTSRDDKAGTVKPLRGLKMEGG